MTINVDQRTATIAVLGNPNTGKSTLFNVLTGIHQQTGNYPGVTIEKRTGQLRLGARDCHVVDLPGTYSLSPRSPDETVAVEVLLGERELHTEPDLILVVVDASNLRRNLFLVSQVLELRRPVVLALNMTDLAEEAGIKIDIAKLEQALHVRIVPIQANKRRGIEALKSAMQSLLDSPVVSSHNPFQGEIGEYLKQLEQCFAEDESSKRFLAVRALFDTAASGAAYSRLIERHYRQQVSDDHFAEKIQQIRGELAKEQQQRFAELESHHRFRWITACVSDCVESSMTPRISGSDRIDRVLTHPFLGLCIAGIVMLVLFQAVFWIADPASQSIDWLKGLAARQIEAWLPEGAFRSLLVNGVIEGVGSVLVFLPQILILFFLLALLEDSGYLARAAYLMDRFLSKLGLNGTSLIPLLSSFACAIPGIMATRVINNPRDRLITILIAPLMTCSARLPVYVLLIAAFVPGFFVFKVLHSHGLVMFGLYLFGIFTALLVAWVLKRTILRGESPTFVMELPSYKIPVWPNVARRVYDGGWSFVRDAGTLIFAVTIIVWAAAYFPRSESSVPRPLLTEKLAVANELAGLDGKSAEEIASLSLDLEKRQAEIENQIAAAYLRNSFLGRGGRLIEPVIRPLGWDWRIGSAVIAAFPAREVVVSTMGVIFGLGSEEDEESNSLRETLQHATWEGSDRPLFTLPVALSVMVFFALCAQCVSTLAVIRRETNSYRWPIFTFAYMTVLAYAAAFLTFQVGRFFL